MRRRRPLTLILCALVPLLGPPVGWAQQPPPSVRLVELNRANQAELEQVRGIGPSLSPMLLERRQQALFADWADLIRRVPGIGPARAARLSAAGLRIGGEAYSPTDTAPTGTAPTEARPAAAAGSNPASSP